MASNNTTWQDQAWHQDSQSQSRALNQNFVNKVFDNVASNYDLMNDILSGGMHRLWKGFMVDSLSLPQSLPYKALDIAGGTGDITKRIAFKAPQGEITVFDINADMLAVGKLRSDKERWPAHIKFCEGNAETLPFETSHFDTVTLAFGIRNVPNRTAALSEIYRVLRPGGQFACLEFSQVTLPVLDQLYETFGEHIIPRVGNIVAGSDEPYRYLVESIKRFPSAQNFLKEISSAGFTKTHHQVLTGGIAALHVGWKV